MAYDKRCAGDKAVRLWPYHSPMPNFGLRSFGGFAVFGFLAMSEGAHFLSLPHYRARNDFKANPSAAVWHAPSWEASFERAVALAAVTENLHRSENGVFRSAHAACHSGRTPQLPSPPSPGVARCPPPAHVTLSNTPLFVTKYQQLRHNPSLKLTIYHNIPYAVGLVGVVFAVSSVARRAGEPAGTPGRDRLFSPHERHAPPGSSARLGTAHAERGRTPGRTGPQ